MKVEKTSYDYLSNVVETWKQFCKGHKHFEQALIDILSENANLKSENERLKAELETTRNYIHENNLEYDLQTYYLKGVQVL